MGNTIAQGGPTYTGVQCLKLNWFWSSPFAVVLRVLGGLVGLLWVAAMLIVGLVLSIFRIAATLILGWKIFLWWLIFIVVSFIWWMIFPEIIDIWGKIAPAYLNLLEGLVAYMNMYLDLYNIVTIFWNSFYPIVGFVLYIALDLFLSISYQLVEIMGQPAIGALLALVMKLITLQIRLYLAFFLPFLRYLPIVIVALTAQAAPIVEIIASVVPFLFPIISWLFGLLFFVLEPILMLVVWAVHKVESFFGARRAARSLLSLAMSGSLLTREMLSAMMTGGSDITIGATLHQQQMEQALDNAINSTAAFDGPNAPRYLMQTELPEDTPLEEPTHATPDIQIPMHWTDAESTNQAHSRPGLNEEEFWPDVGAAGSKYFSNEFSISSARKELGGITTFLQHHPHASYEFMAAEQASWLQANLYNEQHGIMLDSNGVRPVNSNMGRNTLAYENQTTTTRQPWFAGSDELQSSLLLEVLQRECDQRPNSPHCRLDDDGGHSKRTIVAMPHHHHVRLAAVLGTPPHLQSAADLDPLDIERRHAELTKKITVYNNIRNVRTAIAEDIAAGHHIECDGSSICGGPGAKMAHPVYAIKQQWSRFADGGFDTSGYEDMEVTKSRHIYTDALHHVTNAAFHRYHNVHRDVLQRGLEKHGSVLLGRFTGMASLSEAIDHYHTHYSSFQEIHHQMNSVISNRAWFKHMRNLDPKREERPFYDEWAQKQVFHLRADPDPTHGHMRPKIYVEMQHAPTTRKPLYTLELFDFVNDLDCYTTSPRAPLCLPDIFPDNFHFTPEVLPQFWIAKIGQDLANEQPNGARCYCATYFCEPPRVWSNIFPYFFNKGFWPLNPLYVFSPCVWYNVLAIPILILNVFFVPGFLRLASFLERYWYIRPFVQWVFIVPAGRRPSWRVFFCATSMVYFVLITLFIFWVAGAFKPLWNTLVQIVTGIRVWIGTQATATASYWQRIESSQEGVFYNEAYDSNLNPYKMQYNSPQMIHQNSLGVDQHGYPFEPAQMDQLSRGSDTADFARQQARYGVGNGEIPYMQYFPDARTRWERAQTDQPFRLDANGEPRPAPNQTDTFNDAVLPELSMLGSDRNILPEETIHRQIQSLDELRRARTLAHQEFGQAPFEVTTHAYDVWRMFFGWMLISHHYSDLYQSQIHYHQQKMRKHYRMRPWLGPASEGSMPSTWR